jgi:hypothetical protein
MLFFSLFFTKLIAECLKTEKSLRQLHINSTTRTRTDQSIANLHHEQGGPATEHAMAVAAACSVDVAFHPRRVPHPCPPRLATSASQAGTKITGFVNDGSRDWVIRQRAKKAGLFPLFGLK